MRYLTILLLFALLTGAPATRAQAGRSEITGVVHDQSGALIPRGHIPVIESVQEFKVEVNSPPAEFGRFNGGVVNLTIKSGTNDLHGTAFEFVRNEALNARNLFAPATAANPNKPVFRRNQFGFVIGSPIIKGNTFFFGDYQGTRQSIARVRISTVPTLAQRQGNFSSSLGAPLFFQPNGSISTNVTANPVSVTDTNGNTIQARAGIRIDHGSGRPESFSMRS